MSEKTLRARLVNKHDIEVNWLKSSFIPMKGELVVFDIEVDADGNTLELPEGRTAPYLYERFKIGDGEHNVNDLPFATDGYVSYDTEQTLTDEQRAIARKNIAKYNRDWREVNYRGILKYTVADNSSYYNATSSAFNIDEAITLSAASDSNMNCMSALQNNVNYLITQVESGIDTNIPDAFDWIIQDFELLKTEGILTTNTMYVCVADEDKEISYHYYINVNSNGYDYTFFLTDGTSSKDLGGMISYNKNTRAYTNSIKRHYIDDTLKIKNRYADAKAVGDKFATIESSVSSNTDSISSLSSLVGDTPVASQISEAITNSVADWSQTDSTAPDYIKNKPEIATNDEIIALLAETDMLPVVVADDGSILADENENILLW